jgi:hypothetical protein
MMGLVEAALVAFTLLAILTWGVVVVAAPSIRDPWQDPPARRAAVARGWLYSPLWLPVALLVAITGPGAIVGLGGGADHCLDRDENHHHHLCFAHPPHPSNTMLGWGAPLVLAIAGGVAVVRRFRSLHREWRMARTLAASGRHDPLAADLRLLDRHEPIAMAIGGVGGTVLLSTGLLERASRATLDVILAHERAHLARRDYLRSILDRLMASLLPSRVGRLLLARIMLAREQACDAVAARTEGGALAVANALAEVVRLEVSHQAGGMSVSAGPIEARVLYLLEPPPPPGRSRRITEIATLATAITLLGAGPAHHAIERLVTFILH